MKYVFLICLVLLAACSPGLDRVVDQERTNPRLYEPELPNEYVIASTAVGLAVEEILYGMLRAAEFSPGCEMWGYEGPLGRYIVYIWDSGSSLGGFSLVNLDNGLANSIKQQLPLGHGSTVYGLSDLRKGLAEIGYQQLTSPTQVPTDADANTIKGMIERLPPTMAMWKYIPLNLMFLVFPEAMIYFGNFEGGVS